MYKLLQGDCLELMKDIPDKSMDMILCDLPYASTRNEWDCVISFEQLWGGYNRVIKDNGVIALFCDGLFMAELMLSNKKMWRYNLIWDKQRGSDFLNANVKPLKCHEEIAIFYKRNLHTINSYGILNHTKRLKMEVYLLTMENVEWHLQNLLTVRGIH